MPASGVERLTAGESDISCAIRIKQRIQRKGPGVEPWPGPNRGVEDEFSYLSEDIPNRVLIW
jgi:hypothetical protein